MNDRQRAAFLDELDPKLLTARLDAMAENMAVVAGHLQPAYARLRDMAGRTQAVNLSAHTRGGSGVTQDDKDASKTIFDATIDHGVVKESLVRLTADLKALVRIIDRWEPPPRIPDEVQCCDSCLRLHTVSDVYRWRDGKPLCSWCWHFTVDHAQWPPMELLRIHDERGRVTVQQVKDALRKQHPKAKKKNKTGAAA